MEITIELNGHEYTATLTRGPQDERTAISICRDDIWAGTGTVRHAGKAGYAIDDCAAVLGEDVYEALEREIEDAFARGLGADVDPA